MLAISILVVLKLFMSTGMFSTSRMMRMVGLPVFCFQGALFSLGDHLVNREGADISTYNCNNPSITMIGAMSRVTIPDWNAQGVIPPIDVNDPSSLARSPYQVALTDLILKFGTSRERRRILDGFLRFRAALHNVGLTSGFQWIDGSFLEYVELIAGRPPNDIDVVTFFSLPNAVIDEAALVAKDPTVFDQTQVKATYSVDSYFVGLDGDQISLVRMTAYWYSMWSHRRNDAWKGFLEISLDPHDDANAAKLLLANATGGATP